MKLTRSYFFENALAFFIEAYEIKPMDDGGPKDMARDLIAKAAIDFLLDWGIGKIDLSRGEAVDVFERIWTLVLMEETGR